MVMNIANYIVFVVLGCALLWAVRLMYGSYRGPSEDLIKRLLLMAGWMLLIGGMLAGLVGLTGPLAVFPLIGFFVVGLGYFRYMSAERRALLWAMAIAADRGIPLEQAARAFADERAVQIGLRASRLADLLEQGVALPAALEMSRNPLPAEALLAARIGTFTGQMGESLRMSLDHAAHFDAIVRDVLAKCCYVLAALVCGVGVISFLVLKIVPMFSQLLSEFDVQPPPLTDAAISVSAFLFQFWLPIGLVGQALLLIPLGLVLAYYPAWSRYEVPLLQRFWLRSDTALILRALAVAVRQRQEMAAAVALLASQYPRVSIGRRLERASSDIRKGMEWATALRSAGLIKAADLPVLQAAERVGNLPWAMDELADSVLRRFALWLKAAVGIVFPIVILAFGGLVFVVSAAIFLPLIAMIEQLT